MDYSSLIGLWSVVCGDKRIVMCLLRDTGSWHNLEVLDPWSVKFSKFSLTKVANVQRPDTNICLSSIRN